MSTFLGAVFGTAATWMRGILLAAVVAPLLHYWVSGRRSGNPRQQIVGMGLTILVLGLAVVTAVVLWVVLAALLVAGFVLLLGAAVVFTVFGNLRGRRMGRRRNDHIIDVDRRRARYGH